uniref:Uncharacterized protein n=1 Tax=Anopheles minimus TaxID=112268 RepID=A0A182WFJ7_9DIPT
MKRSKRIANRVCVLGRRLWEQCLKEVEEEMRLEAHKRMRLVPKGYIRPGGTQQKIGPPTELYRSEPIKKASANYTDAQNNHNPPVIDGQDSFEDFPQQHQQVVKEEKEEPLAFHSSLQYQQSLKDDMDPLGMPDLPEQHQYTVKAEPDPLDVRLFEQRQQTIKDEQDPLETHHWPLQTIIKKEYDEGQEAILPFDAELRCWAIEHQIPRAAFDALLVLLRGTNVYELSAGSKS